MYVKALLLALLPGPLWAQANQTPEAVSGVPDEVIEAARTGNDDARFVSSEELSDAEYFDRMREDEMRARMEADALRRKLELRQLREQLGTADFALTKVMLLHGEFVAEFHLGAGGRAVLHAGDWLNSEVQILDVSWSGVRVADANAERIRFIGFSAARPDMGGLIVSGGLQ